MSIKIDSTTEEIQNWVSDDMVYDILSSFGYINEEGYYEVSEKTSSVWLDKNESRPNIEPGREKVEFSITLDGNEQNVSLNGTEREAA